MSVSSVIVGGVRTLVVAGLLLLLTGCATVIRPAATPTMGPSTTGTQARAQLGGLTTADRHPDTPRYRRDAFGTPWADTDHDGCNQRDDVLLRDAEPGTVRTRRQGRCDHDVLAGTWLDPYTGRTLTFTDLKTSRQAQAIQIDHLVPLAEAWVSGASSWTAQRRQAFATDLDELLAVDGPTNMAKSDDDPAAWRPRRAFQCDYAIRWIGTKARWHLAVDASERRALVEMLDMC